MAVAKSCQHIKNLCARHCRIVSTQCRMFSKSVDQQTGQEEYYDVVVAGGGMVGAAMASALGHDSMFEDKKVLMLEVAKERPPYTPPESFANRVSALSPGTVQLLTGLNAWDDICAWRKQGVKKMQVWDACSDSIISFTEEESGDDLATIVENDAIVGALMNSLRRISDRVDIRYGCRIKDYKLPGQGDSDSSETQAVSLQLESGENIRTKLLLGADGAKSQVRQAAKFHTVGWEYEQFGVVATLELSEPTENNTAWQRFLPTGPIALLPVSDTHSSLVWSTSTEQSKKLLDLPEEAFVDAVNNAFFSEEMKDDLAVYANHLFGNILSTVGIADSTSVRQLPPSVIDVATGSRAKFPLGLTHSTHYVRPRVALIGDSAHRIHPLAGQGVNLGFGDVKCLTNILRKAVYDGCDLGALPHLLAYETERQKHVLPVVGSMDGLNRLYRTDLPPIVLLRSLGLQATDAIRPLKKFFRAQATR